MQQQQQKKNHGAKQIFEKILVEQWKLEGRLQIHDSCHQGDFNLLGETRSTQTIHR